MLKITMRLTSKRVDDTVPYTMMSFVGEKEEAREKSNFSEKLLDVSERQKL